MYIKPAPFLLSIIILSTTICHAQNASNHQSQSTTGIVNDVANSKNQILPLSMQPNYLSHRFFFYWGYNRAFYTHSDIHVSGINYDFTLFDAAAHDRPSPVSLKLYFSPTAFTIPQYNYRIGYYINEHWSISFGQDHMKYVMDPNQTLKVSGYISPAASEKYAGDYLKTISTIPPDFLSYEHTDGLNLFRLTSSIP